MLSEQVETLLHVSGTTLRSDAADLAGSSASLRRKSSLPKLPHASSYLRSASLGLPGTYSAGSCRSLVAGRTACTEAGDSATEASCSAEQIDFKALDVAVQRHLEHLVNAIVPPLQVQAFTYCASVLILWRLIHVLGTKNCI